MAIFCDRNRLASGAVDASNSMGGFVAQVIAEAQPDLVRKIILAGTGRAGGKGIDKVTWLTYLDVARGAVSSATRSTTCSSPRRPTAGQRRERS